MKLSRELFLFPTRLSGKNTIKKQDEEPYHLMSAKLPKLLASEDEQELVDTLGDSSVAVVVTVIVVPFVLGVLLKGVMAKLWAMLNTYQLINELSILLISVPSNVSTVQK